MRIFTRSEIRPQPKRFAGFSLWGIMARPDRSEARALYEAVERAAVAHITARNFVFLECAISAFMDSHTPEETAAILREHADQLEAYG